MFAEGSERKDPPPPSRFQEIRYMQLPASFEGKYLDIYWLGKVLLFVFTVLAVFRCGDGWGVMSLAGACAWM